MSNSPTCGWKGASGAEYWYFIHALPVNFNPNQEGNYIFAKLNENNQWRPVYIGEGDLAERVSGKHHQAHAISSKGATHVHVHTNPDKNVRRLEECDLLANYNQAYAPQGCNVKIGG